MPRPRPGRKYQRTYSAEDLKNAFEDIKSGLTIYATAKKWGIPYNTIRLKWLNYKAGADTDVRISLNHFSLVEEDELANWVVATYKPDDPVSVLELKFEMMDFCGRKHGEKCRKYGVVPAMKTVQAFERRNRKVAGMIVRHKASDDEKFGYEEMTKVDTAEDGKVDSDFIKLVDVSQDLLELEEASDDPVKAFEFLMDDTGCLVKDKDDLEKNKDNQDDHDNEETSYFDHEENNRTQASTCSDSERYSFDQQIEAEDQECNFKVAKDLQTNDIEEIKLEILKEIEEDQTRNHEKYKDTKDSIIERYEALKVEHVMQKPYLPAWFEIEDYVEKLDAAKIRWERKKINYMISMKRLER